MLEWKFAKGIVNRIWHIIPTLYKVGVSAIPLSQINIPMDLCIKTKRLHKNLYVLEWKFAKGIVNRIWHIIPTLYKVGVSAIPLSQINIPMDLCIKTKRLHKNLYVLIKWDWKLGIRSSLM